MYMEVINGKTYSKKFAFWPVRVSSGQLTWLKYYYIRPSSNPAHSDGQLFTTVEVLLDAYFL